LPQPGIQDFKKGKLEYKGNRCSSQGLKIRTQREHLLNRSGSKLKGKTTYVLQGYGRLLAVGKFSEAKMALICLKRPHQFKEGNLLQNNTGANSFNM